MPVSLPSDLIPPTDPATLPTWLAWLDAHRLAALAHGLLADHPLPAAARAHLAAAYADARAHWLLRRRETIKLLGVLGQEPAIPVMLLKGMALAATLYDDPATRPMNDVDVLIPAARIAEASRRLRRHGYPFGPNLELGDDTGPSHHLNFIIPDSPTKLRLEIHTKLPRLPHAEAEDFLAWMWQTARPALFADAQALVPAPAAILLQAAMHTMQEHGRAHALNVWFYDIDLLWRQQGDAIDWPSARTWAQRLSWEAALHGALHETQQLFDTPLPEPVIAWLAQDSTSLAGYDIVQRLRDLQATRAALRLHALRSDSGPQKARMILRSLFPHPSYVRWRYHLAHPALIPFAYLYRWLDITGDVALTALRALRKRIGLSS